MLQTCAKQTYFPIFKKKIRKNPMRLHVIPLKESCMFRGIVCPLGHLICGTPPLTVCYNPNTEDCFGRLCPKGQIPCGTRCYDPSKEKC